MPAEEAWIAYIGGRQLLLTPGFHWIPFFSKVVKYKTGPQSVLVEGSYYTADKFLVRLKVNVIWKIKNVMLLHNRWGPSFSRSVLVPLISQKISMAVRGFSLLSAEKWDFRQMILSALLEENNRAFEILDVRIKKFDFPPEFVEALKKIAELEVSLKMSKIRLQALLEEAQGEVEIFKVIGPILSKNPEFIDYLRMKGLHNERLEKTAP